MPVSFETMRQQDRDTVRAHIRCGDYGDHTSGLAKGYLQANLVILDQDFALDLCAFVSAIQNPARLLVSPILDHQ